MVAPWVFIQRLRLRACWQWCANGCNNSHQVWDLQYIVGRIQSISLCNPCIMSVRGPNNVGRAVQTDPTLLRHASAITEQRNVGSCWLKSLASFKLCATTSNNIQQGVQTEATCNIQKCCVRLHGALKVGIDLFKKYHNTFCCKRLHKYCFQFCPKRN